ncbi:MAG: hypothetical protein D6748_08745 [Calditrichaeota bacterium]|nr:MAG: hypothetical protein D6748_08745 [Calditrichota bacterium]
MLMVFNKIDLLKEKSLLTGIKKQYPEGVFISALQQIRTEHLKKVLSRFIENHFVEGVVRLPMKVSGLVNRIFNLAVVVNHEYVEEEVVLRFKATPANYKKIYRLIRNTLTQNGFPLPGEMLLD